MWHTGQCLSACGPHTGHLSITRELVRKTNPQVKPRPAESIILEVGPKKLCFNKPFKVTVSCTEVSDPLEWK